MPNDEQARPGHNGGSPFEEPYLSPPEAVAFLAELGLPIALGTLAKMRCVGGGPVFQSFGRFPRYRPSRLREYAASKLSGERRSTSDNPIRRSGPPPRAAAPPSGK